MIRTVRLTLPAIAVVGMLLVAAPGDATFGSGKFEVVTMIFAGSEACATLDKPRATIFRKKNPKKVKWEVTVTGRYWEIRFDPDKPGADEDFLSNSGRLDIKCSQTSVKTVVPDKFIPPDATWPYKILVYECDGVQKGDLICELDPNIDWGDG